ncbi:hypothetical protein ACFVAM_01845 [Streptomyces californicus]|uniref:hypothetical protein n=1 Tax=Streptomyces californicus TaxID=67351 RepID=UPI003686B545
MDDDDPPTQCWHTEPGSPCDWDVCNQPERLAAGDKGQDPALYATSHLTDRLRAACTPAALRLP